MPTTNRTSIVAKQFRRDRIIPSGPGDMFEQSGRHLRQRHKVAEPLKGLEQCQKTHAWRWLLGLLLCPDQLDEIRRVHVGELFGGRSRLQLRISCVADARHLWVARLQTVAQTIRRATADMQLDRHLRHGGPFCKQPTYLLTGNIDRLAAQALALSTSAFETGLRSAGDLLPLKRGPGQGYRCLDISHLSQFRVFIDLRIIVEPALAEAHDPHPIAVQLSQMSEARSEERRVGKESRSRWSPY